MLIWSRLELDTILRRSSQSLECALLHHPDMTVFIPIVSPPHSQPKYNLFMWTDPFAILQPPFQKNNTPDDDLRQQIAIYFSNILGKPRSQILPLLPNVMMRCGKVRIVDGDSITAASTIVRGEDSERNKSYVRVCFNLFGLRSALIQHSV